MKITLLLLMLLQSVVAQAWVKDACTNFQLRIENQTQTTCHLIDFYLISGFMAHTTEIPVFIFPGETSHRFELSENASHSTDFFGDEINLIMNYDCEAGKMVTLLAKKSKCKRSSANVNGIVLAKQNMEISSQLSAGVMRDNTPGTILWTFTDKYGAELEPLPLN